MPDHKFFVADGEVRLIQVDVDRFTTHRRRRYTPHWQPRDAVCELPLGPITAPPLNLQAMPAAATELGASFDLIRVDL